MDQEKLIREVMAEVMRNFGSDSVAFAKKPAAAASPAGRTTKAQYPLGEVIPEQIVSSTGKKLSEFSVDKVISGELTAADFRISKETLEMQAQVAEDVGRPTLANNMRRAGELIAVPDDELLSIYNALRPYRSTKQELYDIAARLEQEYGCKVSSAFVREAADVYEQRGRLKVAE